MREAINLVNNIKIKKVIFNCGTYNNLEYSKIYRTNKQGSIMFKIKDDKLKIETCVPYN